MKISNHYVVFIYGQMNKKYSQLAEVVFNNLALFAEISIVKIFFYVLNLLLQINI